LRRTSISIAAELRRSGIPAQAEITERSLRKVLEAQSQAGARAVIIVGERELAADSVKIKWMKTGEEVAVRLSDIVSSLQK
ncbi:MAG: His/Gly/Thr/Pro-type tRNA ligase C-terminal domain-containing protein, partial [Thaumarchaeota archaeon]|nr:His/Gly/Thr/Pro-type tRNA ligase C-terminal domain-containing protein [Nitrososphaerota archaeon]